MQRGPPSGGRRAARAGSCSSRYTAHGKHVARGASRTRHSGGAHAAAYCFSTSFTPILPLHFALHPSPFGRRPPTRSTSRQ
eukprot:1658946-Prymnesium_polylepis.1